MKVFPEIEIAGKRYPLNFSVRASVEIGRRCGGIQNLGEYLSAKSIEEQTEECLSILRILLQSGADYRRVFEGQPGELPDFASLDLAVGFEEMYEAIAAAMDAGSEKEIEVEQAKNQRPTQSG